MESSTRAAKWEGLGQVELDAVEPDKIVELCIEAIEDIFDKDLYDDLLLQENEETKEFKQILLNDFKQLLD